jgi:hypothetical protein
LPSTTFREEITYFRETITQKRNQGCDQENIRQGNEYELQGVSRPRIHVAENHTMTGGPKYGDLYALLVEKISSRWGMGTFDALRRSLGRMTCKEHKQLATEQQLQSLA